MFVIAQIYLKQISLVMDNPTIMDTENMQKYTLLTYQNWRSVL